MESRIVISWNIYHWLCLDNWILTSYEIVQLSQQYVYFIFLMVFESVTPLPLLNFGEEMNYTALAWMHLKPVYGRTLGTLELLSALLTKGCLNNLYREGGESNWQPYHSWFPDLKGYCKHVMKLSKYFFLSIFFFNFISVWCPLSNMSSSSKKFKF